LTQLEVKVVPGAKRTEIVGRYGSGIKVRISAPPEDGRANRAVVELLSKALELHTKRVRIVHGLTSPNKRVEVDGLGLEEVLSRMSLGD
jgi:hypothetical protein